MPFGDVRLYEDIDAYSALHLMIRTRRVYLRNELEANLKARDALGAVERLTHMSKTVAQSPMTKRVKGRKSAQLRRDFNASWVKNEQGYVELAIKHYKSQETGDDLEAMLERAFEQTHWDTYGFRTLQEAAS